MEPSARDREWLRVRRHLRDNRFALGLAAGRGLYPGVERVEGTPLLTAPGWVPPHPVPLTDVTPEPGVAPATDLPRPRYSELMGRLDRPAVFEDRPTYRLLDVDLPRLRFGPGRYFDGVDTGEAVAHEFAAADLAGTAGPLPLRAAVGDPLDPGRRPVNVAISAVTIRDDPAGPRFLAHRRDPARVAHAGGLLQVVPVGVFQPSVPEAVREDLSPWRCLQREIAEELLGEDEATGPVDHDAWPFERERRAGRMRPYLLGLGVDPLTLATDLLCAVVVDAGAWDRMFAARVDENAEGTVTEHPFTDDVLDRFVRDRPMQAAGAAVLALARRHRAVLLSRTLS